MKRPVAFSIVAIAQFIMGLVVFVAPLIGSIPSFYPAWAFAWYICTGLLYIVSAVLLWRLKKYAVVLTAIAFFGGLLLGLLLSPVYAHFTILGALPWLGVGSVYAVVIYLYRGRLA
jgi:hypothetical protein